MIYTHHPRSRFERRMHLRRERTNRRAWEGKQRLLALRRPIAHATVRRRMRQGWRYYVVHCMAYVPVLMD